MWGDTIFFFLEGTHYTCMMSNALSFSYLSNLSFGLPLFPPFLRSNTTTECWATDIHEHTKWLCFKLVILVCWLTAYNTLVLITHTH